MPRSRFALRGIMLESGHPVIEARCVAYFGFALCLLLSPMVVTCTPSLSFARCSSTGWPCWWWRQAWLPGSTSKNTIVVSCLAAWGTVPKGWNNFKKFPIKVDRCKFVCQDLDWTLNLRTRHPIRRGQFSGQDAGLRRHHHRFLASHLWSMHAEVWLSFLLREPGGSVFCLRMLLSTYVECITRSLEGGSSAIVCPMTMFVMLLLS